MPDESPHRELLDAALDCVITIDGEGRILAINRSALETFGVRREDVIGRELGETIVPPGLRAQHRAGLRRILATREPSILGHRIETVAQRPDGSTFPVELAVTLVSWEPPRFTGFLRDITDRVEAERELRESRRRIVDAADAERRRIERDLHDGAQQRLVALALTLQLIEATLGAGRVEEAQEMLRRAADELGGAIDELRELARGIHPAILTARGLPPALEVLVGRLPIPVELSVEVDERPPAPIEAAGYFVAAESLANVAKHARAGRAWISARRVDGHLVVEVRDDGIGGADPRGPGLRGLADRVEALDGRLRVEGGTDGNGTVVRAELPCAS